MHLVFECAALQMLRDNMPALFQAVRDPGRGSILVYCMLVLCVV